jgi:hypothetical protein
MLAPFTQPPPDIRQHIGKNVGKYLAELTRWNIALVKWVTDELGRGRGGAGAPMVVMARGPSGGMAAGATATVTLYDALTLGSNTALVRNPGPDAVPSGPRRLYLVRHPGVAEWCVLSWSCATDA